MVLYPEGIGTLGITRRHIWNPYRDPILTCPYPEGIENPELARRAIVYHLRVVGSEVDQRVRTLTSVSLLY